MKAGNLGAMQTLLPKPRIKAENFPAKKISTKESMAESGLALQATVIGTKYWKGHELD